MDGLDRDWYRVKGQHTVAILRDPVKYALVTAADQVIRQQAVQIAQLRAELDAYQGRQVIHCTDAQLDNAALSSLDEADGTILRATDTGRELIKTGGLWQARR